MPSRVVRTRNAPSPTGYAHLATIYQSLFDKAYALKHNGKFVLRVENTDKKRYKREWEDAIYEAIDWAGVSPDESPIKGGPYGPYRQSERLDLYKKHVLELVEKGCAYYCFCSAERLEEMRAQMQKKGLPAMYDKYCRSLSNEEVQKNLNSVSKYVIRMKIPENTKIVCEDLVRGKIEFDSSTVDDQVILKSDGFPTYHLAVVVDDHLMEISHVLRGSEWITSFPKHVLLYGYFGWEMPVFVHTPLITNMDGSKLSKRHGHTSVDWFRRKGFLPEAVLNFIALLGWSHPEEREIFSFAEFVKVFDFKDLTAVSPKFDLQKLEWMNGEHLRNLPEDEFNEKLIKWLEYCFSTKYKGASEYESYWKKPDYDDLRKFLEGLEKEKLMKFAEINKPRIKKFEDLLPLNEFFIKEITLDKNMLEKFKKGEELKKHLDWVKGLLSESDWSLDDLKKIESQVKDRASKIGWKVNEVFYPIRIAICRNPVSPPLFESMWILGKDAVRLLMDFE